MRKKYFFPIFIILNFILFSHFAYAYELNGIMEDNNDGTYNIYVQSHNDNHYLGVGTMQGDGTLRVTLAIQGGGVETYIGVAKPQPNGNYTLLLQNNASGDIATGTLVTE